MPDTVTLPQQLRSLDAARLRRYADNLAFYAGDQWPPTTARAKNRRLVFNYAKAIVDKTASYMISGLNVAVDPADTTPGAAARARDAERALAAVYDANQLDQLDFDTEIDAAILGDAAYKVTWDAAERRVRVTAPDVQGLFAWWAGDDVSRVWRVASRYQIDAEAAHAMYGIAPQAAHRTTATAAPTVEIVESWTAQSFELWPAAPASTSATTPTASSPSSSTPTSASPSSSGASATCPPSRSRCANSTAPSPSSR